MGLVEGEELLDVIRRGYEKRETLKGAQKDQDNLSGWREIWGTGQYMKKGQEEGNPKVSSGDNETNLGEWKSGDSSSWR